MKQKTFRTFAAVLLIFYSGIILFYTVLSREVSFPTAYTQFLWSYRSWLGGSRSTGIQILGNILMFVPFGFLFAARAKKPSLWKTLLVGLLFSCLIEALQYTLMRGQLEFDDLLDNTLGAGLGWCCWVLLERLAAGRGAYALALALGTAAVLGGAVVCVRNEHREADYLDRFFCLQVETVSKRGEETELSGFALWYEHNVENAEISLRSVKTGRRCPLRVAYGLERPDVGAYFGSEYLRSGFTASVSGLDGEEEYELCLRLGWAVPIRTGIYLKGSEIRYAPESDSAVPAAEGTDLEALLDGAVLRVSRPDQHCWVYQRGASLYWVFGPEFPLDDDGSTLIEYKVWTLETTRLAEGVLDKTPLWTVLSVHLEKYELQGDFGPYRVMERPLPDETGIIGILTGTWKKDHWTWKNCFRPYYDFS